MLTVSRCPCVVLQALPSVRVLRVSCFFGGTPLGGHLAQLLPGLTELRAAEAQPPSLMQQLGLLEGADAEEETEAVHQQPQRQQEQGVKGVMAPAGASTHGLAMQTGAGDAQQQQCEQRELPPHHWSQQRMGLEGLGPGLWRDWQSWGPSAGPPGDGLGDEGFNALGVVGRAGSEVAGGAGAAGPGLPSAPAGPTASSSRSRVVRCTLPLDVGAVGRLHTYARLRALVLVGPGPAAALLEALRPLTGEEGREGGGRAGAVGVGWPCNYSVSLFGFRVGGLDAGLIHLTVGLDVVWMCCEVGWGGGWRCRRCCGC